MWYLIFATCIGSYAEGTMECTEAQIISEHLSEKYCEVEMKKYESSGMSTLCMEKANVNSEVPRGEVSGTDDTST